MADVARIHGDIVRLETNLFSVKTYKYRARSSSMSRQYVRKKNANYYVWVVLQQVLLQQVLLQQVS